MRNSCCGSLARSSGSVVGDRRGPSRDLRHHEHVALATDRLQQRVPLDRTAKRGDITAQSNRALEFCKCAHVPLGPPQSDGSIIPATSAGKSRAGPEGPRPAPSTASAASDGRTPPPARPSRRDSVRTLLMTWRHRSRSVSCRANTPCFSSSGRYQRGSGALQRARSA
jgi:hypothetical protein